LTHLIQISSIQFYKASNFKVKLYSNNITSPLVCRLETFLMLLFSIDSTIGGWYYLTPSFLQASSSISCLSAFFMDKKIFSSFFRETKIDVECNTIGFMFFEASLNYLWIFKDLCCRHLFVTIGLPKSVHLQLVKRYEETKENDWLLQ